MFSINIQKIPFNKKYFLDIIVILLMVMFFGISFRIYIKNASNENKKTNYSYERYSIICKIMAETPAKITTENGKQVVKQGEKTNLNFNGIATDEAGNKWLVVKGQIQHKFSGFYKTETGKEIFVKMGKVEPNYTGCYIDENGKKRCVSGGKELKSDTKTITLKNKTIQIKNGKVVKEKIEKENDIPVYTPQDLVKILDDKKEREKLENKKIIILGKVLGVSQEDDEVMELFIDPEFNEAEEKISPVFFICNTESTDTKIKILKLPKQSEVKVQGTVKSVDPLLGFEIDINSIEEVKQ